MNDSSANEPMVRRTVDLTNPSYSSRALLTTKLDDLLGEIASLEAKHGGDRSTWTAGVTERETNLRSAISRTEADLSQVIAARAEKVEAVRAAAMDPANCEAGAGGSAAANPEPLAVAGGRGNVARFRRDPWDGLSRSGTIDNLDNESGLRARAVAAVEGFHDIDVLAQERLTRMLDKDRSMDSARYVLALGNPAYTRAFDNWMRSPETAAMDSSPEELAAWRDVAGARAALSTSNGSALMPLVFDPVVHLTNSGAVLGIREYANVQLTTTNQFRAVTSPGITASWKVEGQEASDATPTLTAVDLNVWQGFASVSGSYEIFDDTNISEQLGPMIADARLRAEADAFATGSGSNAPWGFVTRLATTTASRVATTTASSFTTASVVDVYRLRDAVPARHRNSQGIVFTGNIAAASVIQQMSPSANGGSFWANLNDRIPAALLGVPFLEATSMSSSMTGTTQSVLACINLREYQIADRLGTTVERHNVTGANGRSTGQWEYVARWRTSGDLVNYDAGRVLRT